MLKILQIVSNMNYGGVETVVMNYYRNMDRSNLQMDFACYSIVDELQEEIENNHGRIYRISNKNRHPFRRFKEISKILKENNYDIIHVHSDSASLFLELFAAKLAKTKIRIAHSHNTNCFVKWQHYLLRPFLPLVANVYFACSKKAGEWMFPKNDFIVITNGIDFNKYAFNDEKRKTMRKEYKWDNHFIIGNVGNYQASKNQIFLVKLMPALIKKIPEIKLALAGSYSSEAKEYVDNNNLNEYVDFLGIRKDIPDVLQGYDVFVFPSLFEGNPSAVTEACANNLPCIISDQTYEAMNSINFNKHFYHLPLQEEKWIDKIEELYNLKITKHKLDKQTIAESGFDIKVLGNELVKLYEDINTY